MSDLDISMLSCAESRLAAIKGVEALIDRNDVKTVEDVNEVIRVYRAVIQEQVDRLQGRQYEVDAKADYMTGQIPNV